uniref:Uncharacterized protein n=1 Tax=Proboscia inermis TaxID=420281 RepID=A0A7S0GGH1_9STRA|mmetsp:Transcript_46517/g.46982  ORF Transcript_46517/g.46982 Transcript_46517/m.46982 type:complete len:391 (+) Transcript_46517:72-1244(+)
MSNERQESSIQDDNTVISSLSHDEDSLVGLEVEQTSFYDPLQQLVDEVMLPLVPGSPSCGTTPIFLLKTQRNDPQNPVRLPLAIKKSVSHPPPRLHSRSKSSSSIMQKSKLALNDGPLNLERSKSHDSNRKQNRRSISSRCINSILDVNNANLLRSPGASYDMSDTPMMHSPISMGSSVNNSIMSAYSLESARNTSLDSICIHTRHPLDILAVSAMSHHRPDLLIHHLSSEDCRRSYRHDCSIHRVNSEDSRRSGSVFSSPRREYLEHSSGLGGKNISSQSIASMDRDDRSHDTNFGKFSPCTSERKSLEDSISATSFTESTQRTRLLKHSSKGQATMSEQKNVSGKLSPIPLVQRIVSNGSVATSGSRKSRRHANGKKVIFIRAKGCLA